MLQVITKDQAVACVREQLRSVVPKTETAALNSALNRVLSQDVVSNEDIPPFAGPRWTAMRSARQTPSARARR